MASQPISVSTARARILAEVAPLGSEVVVLDQALDRVLAEDVLAGEPVPAFDNSAMDGYAVRSADTDAVERPVRLRIVGEARAGRAASSAVGVGEAVRISTGAALPSGADAVVRQEDVIAERDEITVAAAVPAGDNVRRAGEDVAAGATVLRRGVLLGPAELGVAAAVGRAALACGGRPTVRLVTTGDELVVPGERRQGEGVWNSNAVSVPAQARRIGADVEVAAGVRDTLEATVGAVRDGLAADVLVVCGGVSVGPHDHVKAAFAELAVAERFWGVALRPGHPTWFGTYDGDVGRTLVFGLPGNPVSAMVTFQLFVAPALHALQGGDPSPRTTTAILDEDVAKRPGRAHALRCRAQLQEDGWHVRPSGPQGSHVLTSMLGADALAMLPEESAGERAGARVAIELIG